MIWHASPGSSAGLLFLLLLLSFSLALPLLSVWVELIMGSHLWPTHLQVIYSPAARYLRVLATS